MKRRIIIVTVFALILLGHIYNYSNSDKKELDTGIVNMSSITDYNYSNEVITQKIITNEDNFYKIKLYFKGIQNNSAEKMNYDTFYINVKLSDENENVIEEYKYEKCYYTSDGAIEFKFNPIKDSKDKVYYLTISSYRKQGISISLSENNVNQEKIIINGKEEDKSLIYSTVYLSNVNDQYFNTLTIVITIVFVVLYIVIEIMSKKSIEKKYLIISLIVSLMMLLLTPVYGGNDEAGHWARIYELSNGHIITSMVDGWPQRAIPNVSVNFMRYEEVKEKIENGKEEKEHLIDMQYTSVYSPISYVPQVIGTWIARIVTSNMFYWPYIAKIFQAVFSIILVYYAIKIAPFGKNVIFVAGMIPSFIQATSLLSADAILVSSSLLFISKILQLKYSKDKINKKDYLILTILAIMLSISKLVYFPFVLVLLLLLKKKENKKSVLGIMIIAFLVTFLWNGVAIRSLVSGQGVNAQYYMLHIIKNPLNFIQITAYSFYHQIGNHVSDLFGGANNWVSNIIYDSTIIPLGFLILYFVVLKNEDSKLDKKERRIIGLILFITFMLISTSLYITCTPVSHKEIVGIQGRYFIPFLYPLFLVFGSNKEKKNIDISPALILLYYCYYLNYILYFI